MQITQVSIGDLSSWHVGIGFVFQGERYVTARDLNSHNATKKKKKKGGCAPVKVSARLSELLVRCHRSQGNSLWREKYGRGGFVVEPGDRVTLQIDAPEFLCIVFKVSKLQIPVFGPRRTTAPPDKFCYLTCSLSAAV